ncbi:AEC family transporter [Sulfitobacter pseudonitzschiae]|uniref:AEC family transporter n=1 Tax=Pseudosulfitobacter pseudonitzschiae TaxID=1402135 RepID=A0A9Q2NPQ0_9RHOB|nr:MULTISPECIES: AEC family transporter [Roseobacteraceae]MBM2290464.1 AEC family transporter [Pseudosulfitobacter pseudonitzschiae]MBM2295382.1 AEC family transporter [Pseudosulfitobacter pseudonitzschiae]MBM2300294.1 AEC family transporter [Pseudosulfitobacter pseudonitzschiae]MBM2310079.1 AEC family transporter [Pseudosulfitobacter pseudonitzschiae]MBM2314991.1 AEC family transporter [Pseudosulfitobacter pseudonitzschiae]|tara:strand:+ start:234 stop:1163 length:930 start_codon:yes stop_codon:yes gene_type:complete
MLAIFLKTLPFFALIGLGYWAGRARFFSQEATAYLTKFVFYFALSAMLFRFSANLGLAEVWNGRLVAAYLWGTLFVYGIATIVGYLRHQSTEVTAIEAQCAVIGNTGFLGVPMLTLLLGEAAIGPVVLALAVDLIVFSSLIVVLITAAREGEIRLGIFKAVAIGLLKNPMIVAITLGFVWSALHIPIPAPMNEFLSILGGAATPCALFAIGASLASKSAERLSVAGWLSFCKLVLHPAFVAFGAIFLFSVDTFSATVIISAAALPVAGNIFMLAQHYGVAPQRVSAAILVSTAISIVTVSLIIGWLTAA